MIIVIATAYKSSRILPPIAQNKDLWKKVTNRLCQQEMVAPLNEKAALKYKNEALKEANAMLNFITKDI
jgi:hypothetical protein